MLSDAVMLRQDKTRGGGGGD